MTSDGVASLREDGLQRLNPNACVMLLAPPGSRNGRPPDPGSRGSHGTCCGSNHACVDAALALVSDHALKPHDIERVVAGIPAVVQTQTGFEYRADSVTRKVEIEIDPDIDRAYPEIYGGRVTLVTRDGRR